MNKIKDFFKKVINKNKGRKDIDDNLEPAEKIPVSSSGTKFYKIKRSLEPSVFLLPFLTVYFIFFVFPFIYGVVISFFDWNFFDPSQRTFIGFANYIKILFETDNIFFQYFWEGLGNTLLFVVISVPLLIGIPLFLSILLDIEPKGYKLFRVILFMPTVFSISAVILIWRWQFLDNGGFINSVLSSIGLNQIPFLTTQPWAWISILIITIWWTMGTNMVILGAGLKNIDKTLYEAAAIDGANYFQSLRYITIPALVPQMILVTITTILGSFNIYGQPEMLTNGGPEQSTTVLMMRIRGLALGANSNPGIATAMAICLGFIMIAISLFQAKYMRRFGE